MQGRGEEWIPPTNALSCSHRPLDRRWAAGPGPCSPLTGVRHSEAGLACPLHWEGGPSEKSPPWLGRTGQALPEYEDRGPESWVTSGRPPVLPEVLLGSEHRAGLSSPPGAGDTEVKTQGGKSSMSPTPRGPTQVICMYCPPPCSPLHLAELESL